MNIHELQYLYVVHDLSNSPRLRQALGLHISPKNLCDSWN
jgi:hypothetical protein